MTPHLLKYDVAFKSYSPKTILEDFSMKILFCLSVCSRTLF